MCKKQTDLGMLSPCVLSFEQQNDMQRNSTVESNQNKKDSINNTNSQKNNTISSITTKDTIIQQITKDINKEWTKVQTKNRGIITNPSKTNTATKTNNHYSILEDEENSNNKGNAGTEIVKC